MQPSGTGTGGDGRGPASADVFEDSLDGSFDGGFGLIRDVRLYSREELRAIDAACAEEFGLSVSVLMEHASSQLAEAAARLLSVFGGERALVVCGPGHNGGDGLASARHLDSMGFSVGVVLSEAAPAFGGEAGAQLGIVRRCGIRVVEVDGGDLDGVIAAIRSASDDEMPAVVVDALYGTGLSRAPEGVGAALIDAMNGMGSDGAAIVSADVPSGLDADTGVPPGACVEADLTVSFAGLKRGFVELGAQAFLGEVVVAPIGAPRVVLERFGEPVEADWPERFGRATGFEDEDPGPAPAEGSRGASGPDDGDGGP